MTSQLDTRNFDAIVLAGGQSKRMGFRKALLPLGNTTMIEAVISRLQPVFRQVLVVTRESKDLEYLDVRVVTDDHKEQGPLVGLARGLAISDAPWCFLVGCDMPFLRPEVIQRMALHLKDCDVLAVRMAGYLEPLHAFYSSRCLAVAEGLLEEGVTSLQAIFRSCRVGSVESDAFQDIDPDLLSFKDLDTEDDYQAALKLMEGLEPMGACP